MPRPLLLGLPVAAALVAAAVWFLRPGPPPPVPPPPGLTPVWSFSAPRPGSPIAAPLVTPDAIYLAAVHARGFRISGTVYALDPATGRPRWTFDHDGEMLATASAPVLAGGKLVFGEGMHANFACRVYALDPATGKPHWTFPTEDHVEGGPAAVGGAVVVSAGNDGVYALDAATGKPKWNFRADLHTDSTPCVDGGRVFIGSGPSRRFKTQEVVCLDAATGRPVWRTPVPLPAWGSPVVAGGRVYAGLGNGRLTQPAQPPETPAGGLVCLDAASGERLWSFRTNDAVFARPVVVADRVVFGSRDGNLRGLTSDGAEAFRVDMGGPVMAGAEVVEGRVIAASVPGRIVCVDPAEGRELWRHELAVGGDTAHVYADPRGHAGRLYAAAEMRPPGAEVGVLTLSCFDLPKGLP